MIYFIDVELLISCIWTFLVVLKKPCCPAEICLHLVLNIDKDESLLSNNMKAHFDQLKNLLDFFFGGGGGG